MKLHKCHIVNIAIGVLLFVGAVILLIGSFPNNLIDFEIKKQLEISPDSGLYDEWVNPPPPIYMQYWMYNVTNPKDVIEGKKANVTQIGPFTYRIHQPRYNVEFYANDTVAYQYNHTLVFDPDRSYKDPNEVNITNVNVPLLTVLSMIKNFHIPDWMKHIMLIGDYELFPEHTAYELLFGYEDPIFSKGHAFFPNMIPAKFGLFYGFNNSDDGTYLINSGKTDISRVNLVEKWNYEDHLDFWSSKYGNMLNGTDGVFFHPKMNTSETIYVYSTDICRSLPLSYEEKSTIADIGAYRYRTTEMAFANTTVNPDNAAFCVPAGNCMGSGVLNISVCKQNAPVVISSPHFYLGDQKYINGVNGLNPNRAEHETYLDIEPTTGAVVSAQKRLQLNIQLEPSYLVKDLHNVKITTFPFTWLNESVYIDNDSAYQLQVLLLLKRFVLLTPYFLFGLSALVFLVVAITLIVEYSRGRSLDASLLANVDCGAENGE